MDAQSDSRAAMPVRADVQPLLHRGGSKVRGDPGRVATDGRADTEPVASNSDDAGRALNRRVELLLLK